MSGRSALIVVVPEAEHVVGAHRLEHDPAASRGVPAHLTVLYPFIPADELSSGTEAELAAVFSGFAPFGARFSACARFGRDVLYLAPDDDAPFRALTEAVVKTYPGYPPYEGKFDDDVPHLTVADEGGDFDSIERDIEPWLPVQTTVDRVVLIEQRDRFWFPRSVFFFGAAG
jgi:hypothetical protein